MSLLLIKEPHIPKGKTANDLDFGSWFIDQYDQIYLIAIDDRENEKRVICLGDYCKPFIPNVDFSQLTINRILMPGTILQITNSNNVEGR